MTNGQKAMSSYTYVTTVKMTSMFVCFHNSEGSFFRGGGWKEETYKVLCFYLILIAKTILRKCSQCWFPTIGLN